MDFPQYLRWCEWWIENPPLYMLPRIVISALEAFAGETPDREAYRPPLRLNDGDGTPPPGGPVGYRHWKDDRGKDTPVPIETYRDTQTPGALAMTFAKSDQTSLRQVATPTYYEDFVAQLDHDTLNFHRQRVGMAPAPPPKPTPTT